MKILKTKTIREKPSKGEYKESKNKVNGKTRKEYYQWRLTVK